MHIKFITVLAIFALLANSAFAVTGNFNAAYMSKPNSFIQTDLSIQPAVSVSPLKTVYCVNDIITVAAAAQSSWYNTVYQTSLLSNAPGAGCLYSYTTTSQNRGITWVDTGDYASINAFNSQINGIANFNTFMSGIGVSPIQSTEASQYTHPTIPTSVISGGPYKADSAAYCAGTLGMVSNNPSPAFNIPSVQYFSSISPTKQITLSPAGIYTFQSQFLLQNCLMGGRTYINPSSCPNNDMSVVFYKDSAIASLSFNSGTPLSVTVKNPFLCIMTSSDFSITPNPAEPSEQLSFSFKLHNPATNGQAARVTQVNASWTNQPTINSLLPMAVNVGEDEWVWGNINAPAAAGTYNFNFIVKYDSNGADCSGNPKNCTLNIPASITVTPPPPIAVECNLSSTHGSTYTPLDESDVVATCKSATGLAVDCGLLSWSTNAAGGTVTPQLTQSPVQQTHLKITEVSGPQLNAYVKAWYSVLPPCFYYLNVTAPDYTAQITQVPTTPVNENFSVSITTKNIGAASNLSTITRVQFDGNTVNIPVQKLANGAQYPGVANFTCPSAPGLYPLIADADATPSVITESNEANNHAAIVVNCSIPISYQPDYIIEYPQGSSITANVSEPINITIQTKNNGTEGTNIQSTTRTEFRSTVQSFNVIGLGVNGVQNNNREIICPDANTYIFNSKADFGAGNGAINELNETNNEKNLTVNCVIPSPSNSIRCTLAFQSHASVFIPSDGADVLATCFDIHNYAVDCGTLAWSTTATGGSMAPSTTISPPQAPKSFFSISEVGAPQPNAQVKAQHANFTCNVSLSVKGPDYTPIIPPVIGAFVGEEFTAEIITKNLMAAANKSTITKAGFNNSALQNIDVPKLSKFGQQIDEINFTCPPVEGTYLINATVDATSLLAEENESNNYVEREVLCIIPTPIHLPNYKPSISAPPISFVGISFVANITTKNVGRGDALASSKTNASFQSEAKEFNVPALPAGNSQNNTWELECSSQGQKRLNATVDAYDDLPESNEYDNEMSLPIACYVPPDACALSFVNHKPVFSPLDLAVVRATCSNGGMLTACPPFSWKQNAISGSIFPANTSAEIFPESTLRLFGAPVPQISRKVNVTSTMEEIPLYCEIYFDVSDGTPIGPDYEATVKPDTPSGLIGQTIHFTTTVKNIGNVNATNESTTIVSYSDGCTPLPPDSYPLPALDAGESHVDHSFACTCNKVGSQTITVNANPTQAQYEVSYANNEKTITFLCMTVVQWTCSYFI